MKKTYLSLISTSIAFVALCLASCKKTDIIPFSVEHDGAYFVESNVDQSLSVSNVNFANFQKGDSILETKLHILIEVLGDTASYDRQVYISKGGIKDVDSTLMDNVTFKNPFTFRAGLFRDTLEVTIKRPTPRQQQYGVELRIEKATGEKDLTQGAREGLIKRIRFSDIYEKPDDWETIEPFFGEYSIEKHAFMITVLQTTDFKYKWSWHDTVFKEKNRKCIEALEAYNTAHPEAKKTFTFPVIEE